MSDLSLSPGLYPDPAPPGPDFGQEPLKSLTVVAVAIGLALVTLYQKADEMERRARENHLRGERLAAYRARHRWKAGDVRPLLTIGVNEPAQRRMASLKGKGRPIVKPHRSLEDVLRDGLTNWCNLFREDATPGERRRSLRAWPWWKHHVEALYRGELERARATGLKGAYDQAERAVATALRMSQGTVHAICGEIRAKRRDDAEAANFPPMSVAEFEQWMEHGELPTRYVEG